MIATEETIKITTMSFKEKTTQQLQKIFKLKRKKSSNKLDEWLAMPYVTKKSEVTFLEKLRDVAEFKIPYWNEDELKLHIIYPIIHRIDFYHDKYSVFAERTISATLKNNIKLNGKPDLMLASGDLMPDIPFFFSKNIKKKKAQQMTQLLSYYLLC